MMLGSAIVGDERVHVHVDAGINKLKQSHDRVGTFTKVTSYSQVPLPVISISLLVHHVHPLAHDGELKQPRRASLRDPTCIAI